MNQNERIAIPIDDRHISVILERQANDRGKAAFLTVGGVTYSYREVYDRVQRLSGGLAAVGITEGDRIGVLLPNCAEFVFIWFAAAHIGVTTVVMNPQFRGVVLDTALSDSACSMLVLQADGLAAIEPQVAKLQEKGAHCVVVGGRAPQRAEFMDFETLQEWQGPTPKLAGDYRSIQTVSFTSGSTGPSKGVLVTNNQAIDTACTFVHAMQLASQDVLFTPFALFHGMANRLAVLPCLLMGAHVVLAEKFSVSAFWQHAAQANATIAQTLPTVTALLKAQPPGPWDRAHKITRMYNSRVDEEFEQRFGVTLVEAYGMTEIGVVVYTPYPERRIGASGREHPAWEVRIVDEDDWPVPIGQQGELVFRPRDPYLLCAGYIQRPQATVDVTRNLWFHSGDIARQDADGYIYFMDRKKERIRRRGENISSFDAELIVSAHPEVRECAVLPHPASHGEDDVRLVIVVAENSTLTAEALHAWLLDCMPHFMLPRYIEFAETLPRTPNNKIEKFKLIALGLSASVWDSENRLNAQRDIVAAASRRL